jgi:hypothetical protein
MEVAGTCYEIAWYHIPEFHLVVVSMSWVKDVLLCQNGITFCITECITLQHTKAYVQKSVVEISSNDSASVINWSKQEPKTADNKPNWKPPTKLNTWISIVEITNTGTNLHHCFIHICWLLHISAVVCHLHRHINLYFHTTQTDPEAPWRWQTTAKTCRSQHIWIKQKCKYVHCVGYFYYI